MKQETVLKHKTQLPESYTPKLDFVATQKAIKLAKDMFEKKLSEKLSLTRVTAPRFMRTDKGLQDDLAGTQVPVSFTMTDTDETLEIVHSLAKWKRYTLGKYDFLPGTGLITRMDAIRKDEETSPIHSIHVDQWDWEKVIKAEDRTIDFLKSTVKMIYSALKDTESGLSKEFPALIPRLPDRIHFIHTEELETLYPDLTPKEREHKAAEKYGAVFLIGIGHPLRSGEPHDVRAADYDDWSTPTGPETGFDTRGLDGDIIIWDPVRKTSLELSSMGIRVDAKALKTQLKHMDLEHRKGLEFHKGILDGTLPLSIGGGIGRSRVAMFLLHKAHIGEVSSSVWPRHVEKEFEEKGVHLL